MNYSIIETDIDKFEVSWAEMPTANLKVHYYSNETLNGVRYIDYNYYIYDANNSMIYNHHVPLLRYVTTGKNLTLNILVINLINDSIIYTVSLSLSLPSLPLVNLWSWYANEDRKKFAGLISGDEGARTGVEFNQYFKASMWNDMINLIKSARESMGFDWKSSKGFNNYDTCLTVTGNALMASLFNSLVFNLGNFKFPWQTDETFLGFLGRKLVAGRFEFLLARKEFGRRQALVKIDLYNSTVGWRTEPLNAVTNVSLDKDISNEAKLVPTSGLIINGTVILQDFNIREMSHSADIRNNLKYAGKLVYCSVNEVYNYYYLLIVYNSNTLKYKWYYYTDGWVPNSIEATSSRPAGVYPNVDANAAMPIYVDEFGVYALGLHPTHKTRYYLNTQMCYTDGWAYVLAPDADDILWNYRWFYFDSYGYCNGDGFGYLNKIYHDDNNISLIRDTRPMSADYIAGKNIHYSNYWSRIRNVNSSSTNLLKLAVLSTGVPSNFISGWHCLYDILEWAYDEDYDVYYFKKPCGYEYGKIAKYCSVYLIKGFSLSEGWAYLPSPDSEHSQEYSWYYLKAGGDAFKNASDCHFNEFAEKDEWVAIPYEEGVDPPSGWYEEADDQWLYVTSHRLEKNGSTVHSDWLWYLTVYHDGWRLLKCTNDTSSPKSHYSHWFYFNSNAIFDGLFILDNICYRDDYGRNYPFVWWEYYGQPRDFVWNERLHEMVGPFFLGEDSPTEWIYGIPNMYMEYLLANASDPTRARHSKYTISLEDMQDIDYSVSYSQGVSNEKFAARIAREDITDEHWYKNKSIDGWDTCILPTGTIGKYLLDGYTQDEIYSYYGWRGISDEAVHINIEGLELSYPDIIYASYFKFQNTFPITDRLNSLIRSLNNANNILISYINILLRNKNECKVLPSKQLEAHAIQDILWNATIRTSPSKQLSFINQEAFIIDYLTNLQADNNICKFLSAIVDNVELHYLLLETRAFSDLLLPSNQLDLSPIIIRLLLIDEETELTKWHYISVNYISDILITPTLTAILDTIVFSQTNLDFSIFVINAILNADYNYLSELTLLTDYVSISKDYYIRILDLANLTSSNSKIISTLDIAPALINIFYIEENTLTVSSNLDIILHSILSILGETLAIELIIFNESLARLNMSEIYLVNIMYEFVMNTLAHLSHITEGLVVSYDLNSLSFHNSITWIRDSLLILGLFGLEYNNNLKLLESHYSVNYDCNILIENIILTAPVYKLRNRLLMTYNDSLSIEYLSYTNLNKKILNNYIDSLSVEYFLYKHCSLIILQNYINSIKVDLETVFHIFSTSSSNFISNLQIKSDDTIYYSCDNLFLYFNNYANLLNSSLLYLIFNKLNTYSTAIYLNSSTLLTPIIYSPLSALYTLNYHSVSIIKSFVNKFEHYNISLIFKSVVNTSVYYLSMLKYNNSIFYHSSILNNIISNTYYCYDKVIFNRIFCMDLLNRMAPLNYLYNIPLLSIIPNLRYNTLYTYNKFVYLFTLNITNNTGLIFISFDKLYMTSPIEKYQYNFITFNYNELNLGLNISNILKSRKYIGYNVLTKYIVAYNNFRNIYKITKFFDVKYSCFRNYLTDVDYIINFNIKSKLRICESAKDLKYIGHYTKEIKLKSNNGLNSCMQEYNFLLNYSNNMNMVINPWIYPERYNDGYIVRLVFKQQIKNNRLILY